MSKLEYPADYVDKIICGDCIEVMKGIPDGAVDLVLTDPPYPDYYTDEFKYADGILESLKLFECRQFIFWSAKADFPLDYTARHVWDKITGAACQYDFIYERNGDKRQKVFRGHRINSPVSAQFAREVFTGHKSQKPLNVITRLIEYSGGRLILDPFIGSGTTAIACKNLHRHFIGIEINPDYCKIAEDRLRQGVL